MVISDLNIICLEQIKPHIFNENSVSIDIVDRTEGAYNPEWQYLKDLNGVWYSVYPRNRLGLRTYNDEFFDLGSRLETTFYIDINEKYKDTLISIFEFYVSESPVHEVDIMIWLDGDEKMPRICCSFDRFIELLVNGKLLFGVLYHVCGTRVVNKA